jgi:hypothetical protein
LKARKKEMAKKFSYSDHCEKVSGHHEELSRGFTGLANHFTKAGHDAAAKHCESMAECHKALSAQHAAAAEAAKQKAQDDWMNKVRPDGARRVVGEIPAAERNRLINRFGGAPIQGHETATVSEFGKVSTEGLDPELEDLINPDA